MRIDIAPMLRGETNLICFDHEISPAKDFFGEDIDCTGPVKVTGKIENMAGYMKLTAKAGLHYTAKCARCLKDVPSGLEVNLEKTVAVKGTLENEDNDDYILSEDGFIDIDGPLEEQLLLEFPFRHLCSEECKGLCPLCGKDLNEGACGCDTRRIDPRLEVLRRLL